VSLVLGFPQQPHCRHLATVSTAMQPHAVVAGAAALDASRQLGAQGSDDKYLLPQRIGSASSRLVNSCLSLAVIRKQLHVIRRPLVFGR